MLGYVGQKVNQDWWLISISSPYWYVRCLIFSFTTFHNDEINQCNWVNYDVLTEQASLPHLHWVLLHMQQNEFLLYSHLPCFVSTEPVKMAWITISHPAPANIVHLKILHFMSLNEESVSIPKYNSAIAQKARNHVTFILVNWHTSLQSSLIRTAAIGMKSYTDECKLFMS